MATAFVVSFEPGPSLRLRVSVLDPVYKVDQRVRALGHH
jgi:hypothetical protein